MQATLSDELHSLLDYANRLFEAKKYNQAIKVLLIIKRKKTYGFGNEFGEMIDNLIETANNSVLEQDGIYNKKGKK
jgi:hypothetical protein